MQICCSEVKQVGYELYFGGRYWHRKLYSRIWLNSLKVNIAYCFAALQIFVKAVELENT